MEEQPEALKPAVIPFGKYKGVDVETIPAGYLSWGAANFEGY